MTEKEKMLAGMVYDATDPVLLSELSTTKDVIHQLNSLPPSETHRIREILRNLLGNVGDDNFNINLPFRCDYGKQISVGKCFFANFNLTILDEAHVHIGDDCFFGPNVSIYTACHSTDPDERKTRQEWALPVNIRDIIEPAEGGELPMTSTKTYRQKVLDFLIENTDNAVLKKTQNLEQLDGDDFLELERILWQELGTREDYDSFVGNAPFSGNVAAFIRKMANFDYSVAIQKFQEFIHTEELNSQQMEYLRSILAYVSEYGDIVAEELSRTQPFDQFQWLRIFGDKTALVVEYIRNLHKVITAA